MKMLNDAEKKIEQEDRLPTFINNLERYTILTTLAINHCLNLDDSAMSALFTMDTLEFLNLNSNDLNHIPVVHQMVNLVEFSAIGNKLTAFELDLRGMTRLTTLLLEDNLLQVFDVVLPASLQSLYLTSNKLEALPDDIFLSASSLATLRLDHNDLIYLPSSLTSCTTLRMLLLNHNSLEYLPKNFTNLSQLTGLVCSFNKLTEFGELPLSLTLLHMFQNNVASLGNLASIYDLLNVNLGFNQITSWPSQLTSHSITKLYLPHNQLTHIPPSVSLLTSLSLLQLEDNALVTLPPSLGTMSCLEELWVGDNQLVTLPPSLLILRFTLQFMNIAGNPLTHIPPAFRTFPKLWDFFADSGERAQFDCTKVVCVGHEGIGKTFLKRRIMGERRHDGMSTDGIQVDQVSLGSGLLRGRRSVLWYDLGGQMLYYATHQLFLSARCVYLLVFSMAAPDALSRVSYWLRAIRSRCVVLVGTHLDSVGPHRQAQLEAELAALTAGRFPLVFCSNTKTVGSRIDAVKIALTAAIEVNLQLNSGVNMVPRYYEVLRSQFEACAQKTFAWEEFVREFDFSVDPEDLLEAARFFNTAGVLFFDEARLFVVLDPQWLADRMSDLISVKHRWVINGTVSAQALLHIWPQEELRLNLLSLFTQLRLVFETEGGSYIVPSLLPPDVPDAVARSSPIYQCRRQYRCPLITAGLLGRLMAAVASWRDHLFLSMWHSGFTLPGARVQLLSASLLQISANGSLVGRLSRELRSIDEALAESESILCAHCADAPEPRVISAQERRELLLTRQTHYKCGGSLVPLSSLGDDVSFGSLRVLQESQVHQGALLGEGAQARVYRARIDGGRLVAFKRLKITEVSFEEFRREASLLQLVSHRCLLGILGVVLGSRSFGMLQELCPLGDLASCAQRLSSCSELQLRVAEDVAMAGQALHRWGIAHRDLKADNVFLVSWSPEAPLVAKVADLGLATLACGRWLLERAGTRPFMAPEVLRGEPYSPSCDLYSYAMLLYQMHWARDPWEDPAFAPYVEQSLDPPRYRCSLCGEHSEAPRCRCSASTVSYCALPSECCAEWLEIHQYQDDVPPPACTLPGGGPCSSRSCALCMRRLAATFTPALNVAKVERAVAHEGLRPARVPPRHAPLMHALWQDDPGGRPCFASVVCSLAGGSIQPVASLEFSHTVPIASFDHYPFLALSSNQNVYVATHNNELEVFDSTEKIRFAKLEYSGYIAGLVADSHHRVWLCGAHIASGGHILVQDVNCTAASIRAEEFVVGCSDGVIRVYSLTGALISATELPAADPVTLILQDYVATTRNTYFKGELLAQGTSYSCGVAANDMHWLVQDRIIDVYEGSSRRSQIEIIDYGTIRCIQLIRIDDKEFVIVGSSLGQLIIYEAVSLRIVTTINLNKGSITSIVTGASLSDVWIIIDNEVLQLILN